MLDLRKRKIIKFTEEILTSALKDQHPNLQPSEAYEKIENIDASHNEIDENMSFVFFQNLKQLSLNRNCLKKLSILTPSLIHLDLSHNQIAYVGSLSQNQEHYINSVFDNLQELETLHLGYNLIRHIDENMFRNNLKLKSINLSNNLISSIKQFNQLPNLIKFDLSGNQIQEINQINGLQGKTPSLLSLNLKFNPVTNHYNDDLIRVLMRWFPKLTEYNLKNFNKEGSRKSTPLKKTASITNLHSSTNFPSIHSRSNSDSARKLSRKRINSALMEKKFENSWQRDETINAIASSPIAYELALKQCLSSKNSNHATPVKDSLRSRDTPNKYMISIFVEDKKNLPEKDKVDSCTNTERSHGFEQKPSVENPEETESNPIFEKKITNSKWSAQEFMIQEQNRHLRELQNQIESYKKIITAFESKEDQRKKQTSFYRKLLDSFIKPNSELDKLISEYEKMKTTDLESKIVAAVEKMIECSKKETEDRIRTELALKTHLSVIQQSLTMSSENLAKAFEHLVKIIPEEQKSSCI